MLIRLPSFALEGRPLKGRILAALAARDAPALRDVARDSQTSRPLAAILTSLVLHFEGDIEARDRCLAGDYPNADWRVAAMIVLAACAMDDANLAFALTTLNAALEQTLAVRGPNRQTLRELIAEYTRALDHLAKEAAPRLFGARKLRRVGPISYVVSYPRSGNTMSLNALSQIFQSAWHSVFPGDGRYFSRELYDANDTSVLLVKDHVYSSDYLKNRVVYIVRDGRDSMVSLCRFLEVINDWRISDADGFVDFLIATAKRYQFGFWSDNVRLAIEAQEAGADVKIWRYEDLIANPQEYLRMAEYVAPDYIVLNDVSALASQIEKQRRALDDPQWGYASPPPPELFAAWSWNRGGSNWRTVFNDRARKIFDELGGTEMLLRFGYETSADWWKSDDAAGPKTAAPV